MKVAVSGTGGGPVFPDCASFDVSGRSGSSAILFRHILGGRNAQVTYHRRTDEAFHVLQKNGFNRNSRGEGRLRHVHRPQAKGSGGTRSCLCGKGNRAGGGSRDGVGSGNVRTAHRTAPKERLEFPSRRSRTSVTDRTIHFRYAQRTDSSHPRAGASPAMGRLPDHQCRGARGPQDRIHTSRHVQPNHLWRFRHQDSRQRSRTQQGT